MTENIKDLKDFYHCVEVLNNCSISNFSIHAQEYDEDSGKTNRISGVADKQAHCILDYVDLTDYHIGIAGTDVLLNRMKLFDMGKANSELEVNNESAKKLTIKEGNRKTSFRFSDIDNIRSIKTVSSGPIISSILFDMERFNTLRSVIKSMRNPEMVSFSGIDDSIWIEVKDHYDDIFQDVIGENQNDGNWTFYWNTDSVVTLIQKSLNYSEDKETYLNVSQNGFGFIEVSEFSFLLLPQE